MRRLSAFLAITLLAVSAGAASTSKNVDIIVTHAGGQITSYTFINNGSLPLHPGFAVTIGQAFRRGDLLPGQYPMLRDGADHTDLVWQMDEVATRHQNSDDRSLRHAAFSFQLPPASSQYVGGVVPPGGTYIVEFLSQTGSYGATGKQTLSGLCSGGAGSHDLKVRLTDIRNQDDTIRDSGAGTFRVCANVNNVGRDAPRHLWAGPVLDLYEVRGQLVYDTSGHEDPLLYFVADVYLTTNPDGTPGDVRWIFAVHNSWQNVAAGSAGNVGGPGPAGFPNDPQAISYRPEVFDGAASALNWNGLDATVSSASNPVKGPVCGSDYQGTVPACLNVPGSTGQNSWYYGQATRVASTGTPVGGLANGALYFVYNSGSSNSDGVNPNLVSLKSAPVLTVGAPANPEALSLAQGTGTTTFSYRLLHTPRMAWLTLPPSGDEMWTSGSGAVTYQILPAFTTAEKTYWEETGTVIPMYLGQPNLGAGLGTPWSNGNDLNYHPLGRLNVIGGTQPGPRPDIGLINEYASAAFGRGNPSDWTRARLFTLGTTHYPYGALLNEATGRIPAMNNGPPVGPGGNGIGNAYSDLGAPHPDGLWANPLQGVPNPNIDYLGGFWGTPSGTYISHEPAFDSLTYLVFGSRYQLDLIYLHANRTAYFGTNIGPGVGLRDDIQGGNHYWSLFIDCCQTRGSSWAYRDKIFAAMLGADANQESVYANDIITENGNYYPHWLSYKDGLGSTNYSTSILAPDDPGEGLAVDTYISDYLFLSAYIGQTTLHAPLSQQWLSALQRFYEGVCGGQAAGHISTYYCIDYSYSPILHDGDQPISGGNIGQHVNGTDASDFGGFSEWTYIGSGGQLRQQSASYRLTAGDRVKNITASYNNAPGSGIDQLPGLGWFTVAGPIDNTAGTFYVLCPTEHPSDATCPSPGTGAFTGFTRGGTPVIVGEQESIIYRPTYDPGAGNGYADGNYVGYGGEIISGLQILGYRVSHALADFTTRAGTAYYDSGKVPSQWWDLNVVVP